MVYFFDLGIRGFRGSGFRNLEFGGVGFRGLGVFSTEDISRLYMRCKMWGLGDSVCGARYELYRWVVVKIMVPFWVP